MAEVEMNEERMKKIRMRDSYLVVRKETIRKVQALEEEVEGELITNSKVDNRRIIHKNNTMDSGMRTAPAHNIDNNDKRRTARWNKRDENVIRITSSYRWIE